MLIIFIFIFIVMSFYICRFFFLPTKGEKGERYVAFLLSQLPKSEYIVLNDVTLQNEYVSTQIDHIVISVYGIFVVETKNLSGFISGSETSQQWIKNMYGHQYSFYNPIRQNESHILALSRVLNIPKDYFVSIVAFSNKSQINVYSETHVVYFNKLISTILSYTERKISVGRVEEITRQILLQKVRLKVQLKNHLNYVRNKKYLSQITMGQGVCPYCGSSLTIRHGKYGTFVGCSSYPHCRYTQTV